MDFLEEQALRQQALEHGISQCTPDLNRAADSAEAQQPMPKCFNSGGALSKLIAAGKATKKKSSVEDQKVAELAEFAGFRSNKPPGPEFDLDSFHTIEDLLAAEMGQLKGALQLRGMKCGGTQEERAQRLFLARGLELKDLRQKLELKHFAKQKHKPDLGERQPKRKEQGPLPNGIQRLPNQKRIKTKHERRPKGPKQYGTQAAVGRDGIQIL
jgi:hypothetical protein